MPLRYLLCLLAPAMFALAGCQLERKEKETYVSERVTERSAVPSADGIPGCAPIVIVPRQPPQVVVTPEPAPPVVVAPRRPEHSCPPRAPRGGVSVGVGVSGPRGSIGVGVAQ